MNETSRQKKLIQQSDDLYREIGRFVVQFEHMCFELRAGITFTLQKFGLKNQQLAHILTSELTAEPLRTLLQSLLSEIEEFDDSDRKIFKAIFKKAQDLIKSRNDIIHGTWFIGWASEDQTDFRIANGHKLQRKASGLAVKELNYSPKDFMALSEECAETEKLVSRLWVSIINDLKISKNFEIIDGTVRIPFNAT